MRRQGLGPEAIGAFVASLYLPWAFKWAVGPFVDVFSSDRFGRRRVWIVAMQVLMVATLLIALPVNFTTELKLFTTIILFHNIFGATQDVAIDALACNVLHEDERGLANGLDICYRTVALDCARLPRAFDGYRILQISDPHFDACAGLADAIVRTVAGAEVDLCVLTGDFRNAERGRFTQTEILEPLAAIRRSVRAADGFLAILGNHDVSDMVAPIRRLGLPVLLNRTHHIRRGAHALALTGIDDVHRYYTPAASAALAAHDPAAFGIVLAHSPEMAGEAAAAGYDLYLCGHCHGGQVCLPSGRPLITHLSRHRALYAGAWRHGGMWGYTSSGAGLANPPIRFNCRGEVTEFRLRSE